MARTKRKYTRRTDVEEEGRSLSLPKLNLAQETKRSITIIIFLIAAALVAMALIGTAGVFGIYLYKILASLFGLMAYIVPVLLALVAWILFQSKPKTEDEESEQENSHPYARTYVGVFLMVAGSAALIHGLYLNETQTAFSLASTGRAGGYLGAVIAGPLVGAFGFWAGSLIILGILVIGFLVAFNVSPLRFWNRKKEQELDAKVADLKINSMSTDDEEEVEEDEEINNDVQIKTKPLEHKINMPNSQPSKADEVISTMESITLEDRRDWKLPPFDLLDDNKSKVDSGDIEATVALIKKTLNDFGIQVEMGEVNVGPTVTQYTFRPEAGVKLAQIASLQSNIALALAAPQSLRMELPIPGKALVGIEVPNKVTAMVRIREVMQTSDFVNHKSKLAMALGRDVAGRPFISDLAKMPHIMIAGTTGSGKSVAINSLIVSLLYRNTPQDVKFILVDPKHVELTPYNGIPHLLTPTITEPEKAINALKWAVAEMERRYKLVAEAGKRNIDEYNAKSELPLPYIVIVVDELANLMAVAKADVEAAIVRLASLARAVGIHLVLATQRPSTEVITGLIKANVSSRAAFKLPSQIDSRTILDSAGAEKLLGNGDMLFITAESSKPRRIQGTYIGEKEVHKVVDFFKQQTGAVIYNEEIVEKPKRAGGIPGMAGGEDMGDEMYEEAKEAVMQAGKASASLLQRRLRVGYARAARLLDILEEQGVVGPGDGAKPREVYGVSAAERAEYGSEDQENF
jgi:DNA segregation ATPase FtsK/SpoIIIE, S-DNA-T family